MITVGDLARALDAEAAGDTGLSVSGAAEPALATAEDVALAMDKAYADDLARGGARVAIIWSGADWQALGLDAAIFVRRPRYALAGLTRVFDRPPDLAEGVHPSAIVDASAEIQPGAAIGPFVVISAGVRIGCNARIFAHTTIGDGTTIGDDALIHAGTRIGARIHIGHRFIAQPGAVIGSDGFSFVTPTPGVVDQARETGEISEDLTESYVRINSLGSVSFGDDVEIGANSCIDRGTVSDTTVGDGTKIDNLVQIGHNVRIGHTCLVCGHVAIGGSTVVGDRVVLGGKAAIADHITIGANSVITGNSGVASNVPPNRIMAGYPAVPKTISDQMYTTLRRLPRIIARLESGQKPVSNPDRSE